ncbi:hypothetical protein EKO04_009858 [Ascochyta lentis]|uniref:RING-type domain-containing protein n=1 Tax=Ascochyta lentis TaxID=205686 RepID=A0A8H7IWC8_9PLEO|nr:hypothetical protein EKO04_009858 [Ascochyta lentis]
MSSRNVVSTLLDKFTGLPSKNTFLEEHVLPAKKDDKFNSNKCVQCWGEYTDEHPGVKVQPCGHVFGRDCLREMIKGPTGDLCPFCRVKLFRRDITIAHIVRTVLTAFINLFIAYMFTVIRPMKAMRKRVQSQTLIPKPLLQLILEGPRTLAKVFVLQCTDIRSRNPRLILNYAFLGSSPFAIFHTMVLYAPILTVAYFLPGSIKVWLPIVDFLQTVNYQCFVWALRLNGMFDHPADRKTIACIATVAILLKELIIIPLIWFCCG